MALILIPWPCKQTPRDLRSSVTPPPSSMASLQLSALSRYFCIYICFTWPHSDRSSQLLEKLEASTHKSAKTHAGNVFVTRELDIWPFDLKINGFPGCIMEHFCVKCSWTATACIAARPSLSSSTLRRRAEVARRHGLLFCLCLFDYLKLWVLTMTKFTFLFVWLYAVLKNR